MQLSRERNSKKGKYRNEIFLLVRQTVLPGYKRLLPSNENV